MEPLIYVMAILGCGESDAPCRELGNVETRYASEAECLADGEEALLSRSDFLYPTLVVQCRPAGSTPQLLRGSDVRLPDPGPSRFGTPRIARSGEAGSDGRASGATG